MIIYVKLMILIVACRWTLTNAGTRILIPTNYKMPSDYVASFTRRGKITTMTVHPRFVSQIRMYADMKDHWQQGTAIEPTRSMETNDDYKGSDGTTEPGGIRLLPRRRFTGTSRDLKQSGRPRLCNCRPRSSGRRPRPCGCRPCPTKPRKHPPCRTVTTCGCPCPTTVCTPPPSCTTCARRSTTVGCATTRPYRCPCSDDDTSAVLDRNDDDNNDDDDDDDDDLSRTPPPTRHSCRTTTSCSAATAPTRCTAHKRKSRPKLRTTRFPRPLIRCTCGCHLPPSFLNRKAAAAVTEADLTGPSTDHVG